MPTTSPTTWKLTGLPIVIIGGGGHACVVAEAAAAQGAQILGYLDDATNPPIANLKLPPPPPPSSPPFSQPTTNPPPTRHIPKLGNIADVNAINDHPWIIAIGDLALRRKLHEAILKHKTTNHNPADNAITVVHPTAWVSPTARVGKGVYIGPRAIVHTAAHVHDHAIINSGAIVEHHTVIGTHAHIAPGAVLGGGTHVGDRTLVGLAATTLPGVRIGNAAVVGAGTTLLADLGDGQTATNAANRYPQPKPSKDD